MNIDTIENESIKPPVKGVDDFPKLSLASTENIGVDNIMCKTTTDHIKILFYVTKYLKK